MFHCCSILLKVFNFNFYTNRWGWIVWVSESSVQDRGQGRGTVSNAESIRDQTTVLKKIYDRTEVLLPGRAVPRCHGCVETKRKKKESFRLRIENPITPSPPSLRSFLLSVVSSRSAACRRATTTAGRGRRHHQDHDHQYDVHHIVLVRLVILFVFSLPFLCFNKCGRGKRDFPVSFCS